jgi:uncharacterized PurR-regulated membrane protein YhhQ (DUF165 family)
MKTWVVILLYLAALVSANLAITEFREIAFYLVGFLLIPLDMILRDILHERWRDNNITLRMGGLIVLGGFITWLFNHETLQVAIASVSAFATSMTVNALVYQGMLNFTRFTRMNTSNLFASIADSAVFCLLFFGWDPMIVVVQSLIKFSGGFLFTLIFKKKLQ